MRFLALLLVLLAAPVLAAEPATVQVTLTLPVEVAEALSATAASTTLAGQPTTLQQMCAAILAEQAARIANAAMAAEEQRRKAAQVPALRAWKRRVAKLLDEAEKAQKGARP